MDETERRRQRQAEYNRENGITPETIKKRIHDLTYQIAQADYVDVGIAAEDEEVYETEADRKKTIVALEKELKAAAKALKFERAAVLRDRIRALRHKELALGGSVVQPPG